MVSFRRLLTELGVKSYLDDSMNQKRFEEELCAPGKVDKADFYLIQGCLNTYVYEEQSRDSHVGILQGLLRSMDQNPERLAAYIDINQKNSIDQGEFLYSCKRLAPKYTDVASFLIPG